MARPKIETATLTRCLTSSISSTVPLNEANGPSATFTCSPISNITDGFGRSDTRANLRRHFEVDRYYIAHAAIAALAAEGKMNAKDVARAIKVFNIDAEKANPIGV